VLEGGRGGGKGKGTRQVRGKIDGPKKERSIAQVERGERGEDKPILRRDKEKGRSGAKTNLIRRLKRGKQLLIDEGGGGKRVQLLCNDRRGKKGRPESTHSATYLVCRKADEKRTELRSLSERIFSP